VKPKAFSPDFLVDILAGLPRARAYCIALSGGADSVALLYALSEIRSQLCAPIRAIHINHGLQPQAAEWARFCQDLCRDLGISIKVATVDLKQTTGESLEAAARHARYQVIGDALATGEAVVTAHHQDDQAETVLLHLLKGAGAGGLAAMPSWRPFADGFLFRPLLGFRREHLLDWLVKNRFSWVEDESNKNLDYERNFLRHDILPRLEQRWPAAVPCLSRSAIHQGNQFDLNAALAKLDIQSASAALNGALCVKSILCLEPQRRNNLLYWWLRNNGARVIPSQRQLESLYRDVLLAGENAQPKLRLGDVLIRRYQNSLYKMVFRQYPPLRQTTWRLDHPLELPELGLYLEPQLVLRLFDEYDANTLLMIRFRQGGERFKPAGSVHHRSLKQLFQFWHVPPWKRERVVLVYHQDDLIMLLGYAKADTVLLEY
jgi:tRNA(Ile)-lysidine synthase